MAGRQRLQWSEERSKPVHGLPGIGPRALPLLPFLFPSAAPYQSRGVPLPLRHSAHFAACALAAAAACKGGFAGGGKDPACSHAKGLLSLICPSPHWDLQHQPPFQKSSLAKGCRRFPPACGYWRKISLCTPEFQTTTHVEIQLPPSLQRHKGWFSVFPACWSPLTRVRLPHDHLQGERLQREWKWKKKSLGN